MLLAANGARSLAKVRGRRNALHTEAVSAGQHLKHIRVREHILLSMREHILEAVSAGQHLKHIRVREHILLSTREHILEAVSTGQHLKHIQVREHILTETHSTQKRVRRAALKKKIWQKYGAADTHFIQKRTAFFNKKAKKKQV
jgi:hypothetical protein